MSRTARPAQGEAPTEAVADERASRSPGSRVVGNPWFWAALLLGASVPLVIADPQIGFVAFLLALVGGWLCGAGFVNATLRMRRRGLGALVHTIGAVLAGVLLWAMVSFGPGLAVLSVPAKAAFTVAQFASAPAAGWIWITLIGRLTSLLPSRAKPVAPPAGPAWEHEGRESVLRFPAVPLRMRTLGLAIAAVVAVFGGAAATLLILTGDLAERLGPRLVILVLGAGLALPGYLLLTTQLHRRTVECELRIGPDRLRVRAGDAEGAHADPPAAAGVHHAPPGGERSLDVSFAARPHDLPPGAPSGTSRSADAEIGETSPLYGLGPRHFCIGYRTGRDGRSARACSTVESWVAGPKGGMRVCSRALHRL